MIKITDKTNCCGCNACVQCCPKQCITMHQDEEGFDYPTVNKNDCIDCGLCENVCPVLNCGESKRPIKVYAAKNTNEETRLKSSSRGVFTTLAEDILHKGGVVFGVSFDQEWNAVHTYTENIEGLAAFRGSKYVQSKVGFSYKQVKSFLQNGREVLFTGTPCQIAGLKNFLRKDYPNLLTIEILCHGVPSPKVWQRYLAERKAQFQCNDICQISFRDKRNGWAQFYMVINFKNGNLYTAPFFNDTYFKGFLSNLYLRPSCYACKCKNGHANSDIVIADYWNINEALPEYNDNKGISLVLVNSPKGLSNINSLSTLIDYKETGYEVCRGRNGGFLEHIPVHKKRQTFFKLLNQNGTTLPDLVEKCQKTTLLTQITNKIQKTLKL